MIALYVILSFGLLGGAVWVYRSWFGRRRHPALQLEFTRRAQRAIKRRDRERAKQSRELAEETIQKHKEIDLRLRENLEEGPTDENVLELRRRIDELRRKQRERHK